MTDTARTILILGASRGLGLGLATEFLSRGWRVIATTRGSSPGLEDLAKAHASALRIETLDITDVTAAEALKTRLADEKLTIAFVNAGIVDDKKPASQVATKDFTHLMVTNALSPMRMIEVFMPLVATDGVVGVMSSGLGSIANNTSGGWDVYRASKAALNSLLRSRAARDPDKRAILAIAPGWVRTAMGGPDASLDIATSMRGVAEVLISHVGHGGCAYLDYKGTNVAW